MPYATGHLPHRQPLAQSLGAATRRLEKSASSRWLEAGSAVRLQVRQQGVLRITQGRVWMTFDHAAQDLRVRAGDHFLGCGDSLSLSRGEAVVMEPWAVGQACAVRFNWEPAAPGGA